MKAREISCYQIPLINLYGMLFSLKKVYLEAKIDRFLSSFNQLFSAEGIMYRIVFLLFQQNCRIFNTALTVRSTQKQKATRFIWVFIVLGIHNFVNSWCGCGKTAWCDARIDISKWIFIAIDVHFKPLPEKLSIAGYEKFHLKLRIFLINTRLGK